MTPKTTRFPTRPVSVAARSLPPVRQPGAVLTLLLFLAMVPAGPAARAGAGDCNDPILLGEDLPLVRRESAAGAMNRVEASACLPFPHPGGELYFSWKPPRPASYLIAARPLGSRANLTVALWQGCPQVNNSCLAGADASGPGEPEVIRLSRAATSGGDALTIVADASALGGEPLIEVEVRIEELESPDLEVADARASEDNGFQLALQSFLTVWESDPQGRRVLGVAAGAELDELARQGLGVRRLPEVEAGPLAGPRPEPPTLRFDRFRYDHGERSEVRVYLELSGGELGNPPSVFLGGDSDDIEQLPLAWDGGRYVSAVPVPLTAEPTSRFDGRFSAKPGELLVAMVQDPRLPGDIAGMAIAFAMVKGRSPLGLIEVTVDPNLSPPAAETPGRVPGEPPRPLGALADGEGGVAFLGSDQIIYLPPSQRELEEFLERHGARVVEKGGGQAQDPHILVRFDPQAVDLDDLEVMLELLGAEGEVRLSSPEMLPLLALFAEESLRGAGAMPNFLIAYQGHPLSSEEPRPGGAFNPFDTPIGEDCLVGLSRSWLYLSLFDREVEDGHTVPVAVIDSNFCPFPGGEVDVIGGHNFESGEDVPFGTGRTFGQGGRFHGTRMASLIGARHRNGVGVVGSGGQVAELLLYNVSGFGYLFESNNAIRRAVRDGARVINISWTIPCKLFGINFCKPRHFFRCIVVVGVVGRVATFLVSLGLVRFPPGTALLICGVLVAMLSSAHNQLEDAVAFAEDSDVVVVAASGNPLGPFGVRPVEDFQLIPATFPTVVTVGATDGAHNNTMFFGRAVDVWTRELVSAYLPLPGDDCPPFAIDLGGGSSTSTAVVSGIVAMVRAVNPDLTAAQVRSLLSASTVDTPGTDPRVRAFLRADLAVMAAGALAGLPDPTAADFRFPSLGFDEDGPSAPPHYGPDGTCIAPDGRGSWPRTLRPANDTEDAATEMRLGLEEPGAVARGEPDHAVHDYTATGDRERDWFVIPGLAAPSCEVFDVELMVEWPHDGGPMRPEPQGIAGRLTSTVGADTTETRVLLEEVWMNDDFLFEVTGDDNVYEVSVRLEGRRSVAPDRFEPNQGFAAAVSLPRPGLEFDESRASTWISYALEVPDLGFHCPDDVDFFRVRLPEADESCVDLEICGGERTETLCADLRITGADDIRVFNLALEDVTPPGRPLTIERPRTAGLSEFYVAFRSSGRQARSYAPLFLYRVPRAGTAESIEEWFDDWRCCALREMRDCREPPGKAPGEEEEGGRIGADLLDLARIVTPAAFRFDVFCPVELCDPPASQFHLIDLRGQQAAGELEVFLEAEGGFREGVLVEVVDLDFEVVARGEFVPMDSGLGGNRGGGAGQAGNGNQGHDANLVDGTPGRWRLELGQLPEGVYFLRLRGLERGEVYWLETSNPLPSLEPPAARFRRGDSNDDGVVDLSDALATLNHLFLGGPAASCADAGDSNDDGQLDITDPVRTLNFLFLGAPPPPAPGPQACGADPTPDALEECRPSSCAP